MEEELSNHSTKLTSITAIRDVFNHYCRINGESNMAVSKCKRKISLATLRKISQTMISNHLCKENGHCNDIATRAYVG